jgi:cyclic pyranopterin phosphate synthase
MEGRMSDDVRTDGPDEAEARRDGTSPRAELAGAAGAVRAAEAGGVPRQRDAALTHVGPDGRVRMVDVSAKPATVREATAAGCVRMLPRVRRMLLDGALPKGDALATARIAGVLAAKRTAELIPLCHALPLTDVAVDFAPDGDDGIVITATARTTWRTGVEMEALTAVSVAALTVYDMIKAVDRYPRIGDIRLTAKRGGRSGDWTERR